MRSLWKCGGGQEGWWGRTHLLRSANDFGERKKIGARFSETMSLLLFTDLDGTLLNHDNYAYEGAKPALKRIEAEKIPLIIVTSKTRQEVKALQKELGLEEPFIVENGGGIFFPQNYSNFKIGDYKRKNDDCVVQLGRSYDDIRRFFLEVKAQFGIKGFGDMDVQQIINLTGLPRHQAQLAQQRDFTEPFIIEKESKIDALEALALKEGMKITRGGRFYHLIGIGQDKGKAVEVLIEVFKNNLNNNIVTVGLGDSQNDIPMLQQVDIPVLIPKLDGEYEDVDLSNMIRAKYPGSIGWNETVIGILDRWL